MRLDPDHLSKCSALLSPGLVRHLLMLMEATEPNLKMEKNYPASFYDAAGDLVGNSSKNQRCNSHRLLYENVTQIIWNSASSAIQPKTEQSFDELLVHHTCFLTPAF